MSKVAAKIRSAAQDIYRTVLRKRRPSLDLPVRSLDNVRYNPRAGYFEIGRRKKERTLTVGTARTFAQSLRMISLSVRRRREAYQVDPGA